MARTFRDLLFPDPIAPPPPIPPDPGALLQALMDKLWEEELQRERSGGQPYLPPLPKELFPEQYNERLLTSPETAIRGLTPEEESREAIYRVPVLGGLMRRTEMGPEQERAIRANLPQIPEPFSMLKPHEKVGRTVEVLSTVDPGVQERLRRGKFEIPELGAFAGASAVQAAQFVPFPTGAVKKSVVQTVRLLAKGEALPEGFNLVKRGPHSFAVQKGLASSAREAAMNDLVRRAETYQPVPVVELRARFEKAKGVAPESMPPELVGSQARWEEELKFSEQQGWKTTRLTKKPPEGWHVEYGGGAWYVKDTPQAAKVTKPRVRKVKVPPTEAPAAEPPAGTKQYVMRQEPEPLYKSGQKYVLYESDGTPRYLAAETPEDLAQRLRETEPSSSIISAAEPPVTPAAEAVRAVVGVPRLPPMLAGAKPRYNIGQTTYEPTFQSDVDKALYIVAQTKPSAKDAEYIKWLQGVFPDETAASLRAMGGEVRGRIKELARLQPEGGTLVVPSRAAKAPVEAAHAVEPPIVPAEAARAAEPEAIRAARERLEEATRLREEAGRQAEAGLPPPPAPKAARGAETLGSRDAEAAYDKLTSGELRAAADAGIPILPGPEGAAAVREALWEIEAARLGDDIISGKITREEVFSKIRKTPPKKAPPSGGPSTGEVPPPGTPPTAPRPEVYDPLSLRPRFDTGNVKGYANNPELVASAAGRLVVKYPAKVPALRALMERVSPGLAHPTDELTALIQEHSIGRVKVESYATLLKGKSGTVKELSAEIRKAAEEVEETAIKYGNSVSAAAKKGAAISSIADKLEAGSIAPRQAMKKTSEVADVELSKVLAGWFQENARLAEPDDVLRNYRVNYQMKGQRGADDIFAQVDNFFKRQWSWGDASSTGIQTLTLGVLHPKAFVRSTGGALRSLAQSEWWSNLEKVEEARIKRMSQAGGRWTEMTPVTEGRGFGPQDIPLIGGLVRGSDLLFARTGNLMRLNMWKMLEHTMVEPETKRVMAEWLNRATGMTTTNLGPIESRLFFAARFVRSTMETILSVLRRDAVGTGARNVLGTFASFGLFSIYFGNALRGKETDMDPDSNNFLTLKDVMHQDFQMLGPVHPYIRAVAISIKHGPVAAAELAREEGLDPRVAVQLLKGVLEGPAWFVGGRLAPSLSVGKMVATGETFSGEYLGSLGEAWTNPGKFDWVKFFKGLASETAFPFSVRGVTKGVERAQLVGKATEKWQEGAKAATASTITSILGMRGQPLSPTELINKVLGQMDVPSDVAEGESAKTLEDLTAKSRRKLEREVPLIGEIRGKGPERHGVIGAYQDMRDEQYDYQNDVLDEDFKSGKISAEEWKDARQERYIKMAGALELAERDTVFQTYIEKQEKRAKEGKHPELAAALSGYYKMLKRYSGQLHTKAGKDAYFTAMEEYLDGLPEGPRRYVENSIGINRTPLEEEYTADMKKLKPYLSVQKNYIKGQKGEVGAELEKIAAIPHGTPERRAAEKKSSAWQRMEDGVKKMQKAVLKVYPQLVDIRAKWFGSLTTKEQKAKQGAGLAAVGR